MTFRIATALLLTLAALPAAASAAGKPGLSAAGGDEIAPKFDWRISTYAARCNGGSLSLEAERLGGWRASADGKGFGGNDKLSSIPVSEGEAVTVEFEARGKDDREFHIRCLPADFPAYSFKRVRSGGPEYFFMQMANNYAVAFDRNGVPVWWLTVDGHADDVKLLPDGTVSMNTVANLADQTGEFDVYSLRGKKLRTVGNGLLTDIHDLLLLPNGNYVLGVQEWLVPYDTLAYTGVDEGGVYGIDIQELSPDGEVVYSWKSSEHIPLEETPERWWDQIKGGITLFDVSHWNAVEYQGPYMYLSFRHLDALYKVDRRSNEIVWKLGGLPTDKSLTVKGHRDNADPLGGQHDVRVLRDGTITVFNNRTFQAPAVPAAERYRINEQRGTAKLIDSITDKKNPVSGCCGSSRRLPSGDWIVAWGGFNGFVGGYRSDGKVEYRLRTPGGFTYRAHPTADGALKPGKVRRAMDAMYAG